MESVINKCIINMLKLNIIEDSQKDVMVYGLDLLFSSVVNLISIFGLSVVFDVEIETFVLLLFFIPLQSFGGGYHCQTHLKCWLLMLAGYVMAMCLFLRLPTEVLGCGALLSAYSFVTLAPIENSNAPFGDIFKRKMHRTVVVVYVVALILAGIGYYKNIELVKVVLIAVNLSAISIISAKMKQIIRRQNGYV